MNRTRRVIEVAALMLVLGGLVGVPAARGQEVALGGYQVVSSAAGIAAVYDQPSSGFFSGTEIGIARTRANVDSGPAGYALASALWPGDLIANLGPVITGEAKKGGAPDWFPSVPAYPVRAESFYPQGPENQQNGVGGTTMTSRTRQDFAEAVGTTSTADLPAVLSAAHVASSSRARREGGLTVSEATSTVSHVSILEGFITIDEVLTTARATSDSVKGKVAGGIRVSGLRIGENEVSIDEGGLHFFGTDSGPIGSMINETAEQMLGAAGVRILLAGPVDVVEGASASRTVGGLVIAVMPGALGPQVPDDLRDLMITIVVGGASVAARATPVPTFDVPVPPIDAGGTDVLADVTSAPFPVPDVPLDVAAPPPAQAAAPPPQALVAQPVAVPGVPAGLAALVVLLVLAGSRALTRGADVVLAARAASACPLDGRETMGGAR